MKKNGYEETTIMATDQRLKLLARTVNLDNPEEVKDFIDLIRMHKYLLIISISI